MKTLIASFFQFFFLLSVVNGNSIILNVPCGSIAGVVSEDTDGDNIGDIGITGVTINLYTDANMNGVLDGIEGDAVVMIDPEGDGTFTTPATVVTVAPDGAYIFEGVPTGQYVISQIQPAAYLNQVEYDGGSDKDHPDNGQLNSIPVIVDDAEVDSGNNFILKRPNLNIGIITVPGTISDLFDIVASGSVSSALTFANNPISSGQSTGPDMVYIGETIDVMLSNSDNNATLQNHSINYEVKDELGNVLLDGSTLDGKIQIVNNNKDATFTFAVPEAEVFLKIIIVKQGRIVFIKETVPAGDPADFTINKTVGGTGLPASFTLDGEAVDVDMDGITNQTEFQLSGGEQGIYTLQEQTIEGWSLSNISCITIEGTLDSSINIPNGSISMDIQNGDKCICTFTNIKMGAISGSVNSDDIGISGVIIRLQDASGSIINSTITSDGTTDVDGDGATDPEGLYYFGNVIPGDYNIIEEQPDGFDNLSEADGGSDNDKIDNGIVNNIPSRVLPGEMDGGNTFVEQSTVLAVELGEFNVRAVGCQHNIYLRTLEETNNEGIEIQHSHNGSSWKSIKTFTGQGTSNIERDLTYTWEGKSKVSFFRLKFTDANGEDTYSSIIRSTTNCYSNRISIYPNPSNHEIEVHIEDTSSKDFLIQLIDRMGRVVMEGGNINAGLGQSYVMDISAIVPGIYILKVRDLENGEVTYGKVVKSN